MVEIEDKDSCVEIGLVNVGFQSQYNVVLYTAKKDWHFDFSIYAFFLRDVVVSTTYLDLFAKGLSTSGVSILENRLPFWYQNINVRI